MNRYGKYFLAHALWLEDSFCRYYVQEFRHLHREIFDVESVRFFDAENARHWLTRCHNHDPYTTDSRLRMFLACEGLIHYQVYLMDDHEIIDAVAFELTRLGNPVVIEPRCGIAVQVDNVAMDSLVSIRVEPTPDVDSLMLAFSATLDEIVAEQQKSYDEIEAELAAMGVIQRRFVHNIAFLKGVYSSIRALVPEPSTLAAIAKFSSITLLGSHYLRRTITERTNPHTLIARDIEQVYKELEELALAAIETTEQAKQVAGMLQVLFSEPDLMGILHDFVKLYRNAVHPLQKIEFLGGAFADVFITVIISLVTTGAGAVVAVAAKSRRFAKAAKQLKEILDTLKRIESRVHLGFGKGGKGGNAGGGGGGYNRSGGDRQGDPPPNNQKNERRRGEGNRLDENERRAYVIKDPKNTEYTGEVVFEGCFLKGTLVSTAHGKKNIEDVKKDEKLWSYNISLCEWELSDVKETLCRKYEGNIYSIVIDDIEINVTSEHPFYVGRKWKKVSNLKVGDRVLTRNGQLLVISSILIRNQIATVYNITVSDNANYAVSSLEVLVHNKGDRKVIRFGKLKVSAEKFHREIKPAVLKKAGKFQNEVGNNPDVKIVGDKIHLQGTGPFKGKSMKTDLNVSDFFK